MTNLFKQHLTEFWAYLKVIILSAIVYIALTISFDINNIQQFIITTSTHWVKLFSIFLAASFGFYWNYFKQNDSEFGEWLHWKGANKVYSRGFCYPIAIYIITITLLIIVSEYPNNKLSKITLFCMIYGTSSLVSLLITIQNFMKLMNLFRKIHRAESKTST